MSDDLEALNYDRIHQVNTNLRAKGERSDFSSMNRKELLNKLKQFNPKVILEIGVENNPEGLTSTSVFLDWKPDDCYYFGVDILDRSSLDNPAKNIYTLRTRSENVEEVMEWIKSHVKEPYYGIDFLFIDGWHSTNQVRREFEGYTSFLSEDGIIGVHDTNHHLGPQWLLRSVDRNAYHVENYSEPFDSDFGIGFLRRK